MFLPTTNGAQIIYNNGLKPLLKKYEGQINATIDKTKNLGTDAFNEGLKHAQDPTNLLKAAQAVNEVRDAADNLTKKDD
jgi:hypothetical protein